MSQTPSPQRGKTARIAFEYPNGQRLVGEAGVNQTFWEILTVFEAANGVNITRHSTHNGQYEIPVVSEGHTELGDLRALLTSSLKSLRISTSGGVLFRLKFQPVDFALEELEGRIAAVFQEIAEEETNRRQSAEQEAVRAAVIDDASRRPDMLRHSSSTERLVTELDQRMGLVGRQCYALCKALPPEEFPRAMNILKKVVGNLTKTPKQDKYRTLNVNNAKLKEILFKYQPSLDFLQALGFTYDETGERLVLLPANESDELIRLALNSVERARPVAREVPIPTVDRQLKVFDQEGLKRHRAQQSSLASRNAPVANHDPVAARLERKLLAKANADVARRNRMMNPTQLMGAEKRKELFGGAERKYEEAVIQVEFPSRLVVECRFHPREPVGNLRDFVTGCLDENIVAAHLETQLILPPREIIRDFGKSFKESQMVPAATVRFRFASETAYDGPYLRADLVERVSQDYQTSAVPTAMNVDEDGKDEVPEPARGSGRKKGKGKFNAKAFLMGGRR